MDRPNRRAGEGAEYAGCRDGANFVGFFTHKLHILSLPAGWRSVLHRSHRTMKRRRTSSCNTWDGFHNRTASFRDAGAQGTRAHQRRARAIASRVAMAWLRCTQRTPLDTMWRTPGKPGNVSVATFDAHEAERPASTRPFLWSEKNWHCTTGCVIPFGRCLHCRPRSNCFARCVRSPARSPGPRTAQRTIGQRGGPARDPNRAAGTVWTTHRSGPIWIGTSGGCCRWAPQRWSIGIHSVSTVALFSHRDMERNHAVETSCSTQYQHRVLDTLTGCTGIARHALCATQTHAWGAAQMPTAYVHLNQGSPSETVRTNPDIYAHPIEEWFWMVGRTDGVRRSNAGCTVTLRADG